ncbi:MAG TPA: peptidoglycan-binding protein [Coleofasciculaceae cyanobacterium]|jgi:peptidoglycan hydrolase-like protein with peptidoglycan-binding domain
METLAYTHLAIAHEEVANLEPGAYELKLFKELDWKLPSSAWISLVASVMALSILNLASSSLAAYVRTNGSPLNVRSSPAGRIVGSLNNGTYISPNGQTSGNWTQLSWGNWVSSYWITGVGSSGGGGTPSGYLQYGSNGQAVVNLQNRLKVLGFYNGPITGYYGSLTETAVRRFQSSRGIQVNGIAGPNTQASLYGSSGGSGGGNSGGGNSGGGGTPSSYLQPGSSGQAVVDLQNRLKALGFYNGPTTGYYGSLTETSVRRFQSSRGIQVNGIAGLDTQASLYGSSGGSGNSSSGTNSSGGTEAVAATGGGALGVYSKPGGAVIYTVPSGSYLYLTGRTIGSWAEIEGGGWVSENSIRMTGRLV